MPQRGGKNRPSPHLSAPLNYPVSVSGPRKKEKRKEEVKSSPAEGGKKSGTTPTLRPKKISDASIASEEKKKERKVGVTNLRAKSDQARGQDAPKCNHTFRCAAVKKKKGKKKGKGSSSSRRKEGHRAFL